jgi:hypothetical protein
VFDGDEIILGPLPKGITEAGGAQQKRTWNILGHTYWMKAASPAGRLAQLFDQLHDLTDPAEVVRLSAGHDVDFLPPGTVPGA